MSLYPNAIDGTWRLGPNGEDWFDVYTEGRTTWFTNGPNQVVWGARRAAGTVESRSHLLHYEVS